jgi:hypothetical protein
MAFDLNPLAMQKVEGSNPFSRLLDAPLRRDAWPAPLS